MNQSQMNFGAMRKCVVVGIFLIFALHSRFGIAQENSPKQTVGQFCQRVADGEQLAPDGPRDFSGLLVDARELVSYPYIVVIRSYSVRELGARTGAAEFEVQYQVLGQLDSSLRFTPTQAPQPDLPVLSAKLISVVWTDAYFDLGTDSKWQQVRGTPQWRIKSAPSEPHVTFGAVISYVRNMSHRSRDPLVRENAQRTLAVLQNFLRVQASPAAVLSQPAQQSAVAFLSDFIAKETNGAGLNPEGAQSLDPYFVRPPAWRRDRLRILKDYAVKQVSAFGEKAALYIEFTEVGELDSNFRFTRVPQEGQIVRQDFALRFDNKYTLPTRGTEPAKQFVGPSRWRIASASGDQWITVSAAIRYLENIRDTTTSPLLKNNAEKALAGLQTFASSRP